MRKQYNTYDFNPDSSFIPMQHHCNIPDVTVDVDIDGFKSALEEKLNETVKDINNSIDEKFNEKLGSMNENMGENIGKLTDKLDEITHKIKHAEHHIIDEIETHSIDNTCLCHLATKKDIDNAVTTLTDIIDNLEITDNFENLNNQIKNLKL